VPRQITITIDRDQGICKFQAGLGGTRKFCRSRNPATKLEEEMLRPSSRLVTGGLRSPCFRNISIQPTRLVVRESPKSFKLVQSRAYTAPPAGNSETLSWNEFLRLRRQRLICGTLASIPCSILGLTGGVYYFGRTDLDPTQTIMGMDPFIMNTLFIIGCGALGWLVGPSIGRGIWQLFHVRQSRLMTTVCGPVCRH